MSKTAQNAIQQDASEQLQNQISDATDNLDGGAENLVSSPRMDAMERIAAQRRQALAKDGVDITGMDTSPAPRSNADDPDADPDTYSDTPGAINDDNIDQLAAQLGQDDRPTPAFASDNTMVRVKVDGVEMDLPITEVVKSYQKDATATKRLQQATELLRSAELAASKVAQNNEQANNSDIPTDSSNAVSKEERLSQVKAAFSKLYEGDEEGAAQAMLELIGAGATPATQTINPDVLAAQVVQQLEVKSAYGEVQRDYPEVFANDERGVVLGKAAYERKQAKEAQGIPPQLAVREAVEEVAQLFGIQKQGRQATQPRTARESKLERKQTLDVPGAANVVAGNPSPAAEAPNVSATIREMAQQRLGQSMRR